MSARRSHGNVHYNHDEVMHAKSFQNVDGTLCQQDARTRFAYLVVSKAEALEIAGSLKDDKAVVDAIKGKYASHLSKGIEEEKADVAKSVKLLDHSYPIDGKLVHTFSVPARNASCEAIFLKGMKFNAASKNVDEAKKVSGEKKNVSYLKLSLSDCRKLLAEEHAELKRTDPGEAMCRPYALVSVPYVYNARYDATGAKSYECTSYDAEVCVSLMPKVRVEYGIFFDGTNNNMYNIDFYQDYKKLVTEQSEYVRTNAKPYDEKSDQKIDEDVNPIDYIATHPDPVKDPRVMKNLRNEIVSNVRYFEESSTLKNRYGNDKASKDAEKVFDFLKEIRDTVKEKDESWLEVGLEKVVRGYESVTGTAEEIKTFLLEHIMPTDDKKSSYVNGYTNIKRLYDHYEGSDRLNPQADNYDLKSFKLYASGSGTVDPIDRKKLDGDEKTGLGLGVGDTGVKAHVVFACEKIAKELNAAGVEHIDELVLDVFGFSRGATEARHFVCSIQQEFELLEQDGYAPHTLKIAPDENHTDLFAPFYEDQNGDRTSIELAIHYNPIRAVYKHTARGVRRHKAPPLHIENVTFRHVNIGDTVTHHWIQQSNDYKELNLNFDPDKVGSVYHAMAMDEYRYNFDVYSIFDTDYDDVIHPDSDKKRKEVVLPGAHADVGGGYENAGPEETVHLMQYTDHTDKNVLAWNEKYGWLLPEAAKHVHTVAPGEAMESSGFYDVSDPYDPSEVDLHNIYMRRTNLSWLYELVTLSLMHAEAVDAAKDENDCVPLKGLLPEYDLRKLKDEGKVGKTDADFLIEVHGVLAKNKPLNKEQHQKLRQRFMHHSSTVSFVNKPSSKGNEGRNDEVYGRRAIYGATKGTKFPLLAGLASKFAGQ